MVRGENSSQVGPLTLGNGDVLEQQDDCRDREVRRHGRDHADVDDRAPNMLEASRDCLQDLNRILARRALVVAAVEEGCDRQDDDHERVPEHRDEKEHAFWAVGQTRLETTHEQYRTHFGEGSV